MLCVHTSEQKPDENEGIPKEFHMDHVDDLMTSYDNKIHTTLINIGVQSLEYIDSMTIFGFPRSLLPTWPREGLGEAHHHGREPRSKRSVFLNRREVLTDR